MGVNRYYRRGSRIKDWASVPLGTRTNGQFNILHYTYIGGLLYESFLVTATHGGVGPLHVHSSIAVHIISTEPMQTDKHKTTL